ncbi:hypothetical protein HPG69_000344, partial [Diceros bicornis minor]
AGTRGPPESGPERAAGRAPSAAPCIRRRLLHPVCIACVLPREWKFGMEPCRLWLVSDYLVCAASVFSIVLITSGTRAVRRAGGSTQTCGRGGRRGHSGGSERHDQNTVFKMALVSVAAFLLCGPAIISWEYVAKRSILPHGECYAESFHIWYFLMMASTEFFTLFISVTYFNLSIYINNVFLLNQLRGGAGRGETRASPPGSRVFPWMSLGLAIYRLCRWTSQLKQRTGGRTTTGPVRASVVPRGSQNASTMRLSQDKQVAKSLAIVCASVLCRAPDTLLMIIRTACQGYASRTR